MIRLFQNHCRVKHGKGTSNRVKGIYALQQRPVEFSIQPEPSLDECLDVMEDFDDNNDIYEEQEPVTFESDLIDSNFDQICDSYADFLNKLETIHRVSQTGVAQICKEVLRFTEWTHQYAIDKIGKFCALCLFWSNAVICI